MPLYPTWNEIALRLALTMLAAGVIGINRGVGGHEAGLRTTILVGLAASVAMIQANLLLPLAGKTSQSFAVMDLMRLPLGILTGVGFIGGGAILRRGDLVSGVTTAATLWLVTVIGLCLGGGQIALGVAATVLGFFTLWAMKTLEARTPRKRRAILTIVTDKEARALALVEPAGIRGRLIERSRTQDQTTKFVFEIFWSGVEDGDPPQSVMDLFDSNASAISVRLESDVER